uniref:Myb_DNA-bind_5 domain-containing protein n=1 Tax=Angiostrongylus cantonensis TaxID=6313 RepID=A0A0K0CVJ8_ANGCA
MDFTQKRKKSVNWCSQENDLIIKLFLESYNTYYLKFSDGSKKGIKAVRDSLHEKWAEQLTNLRFARRTPAQVAEKIKKSIIVTRKFINTNGENIRTKRMDDLPPHLKQLEKKLREEYTKQSNDTGLDLLIDDSAARFYDFLKNVKEESLSPVVRINADEARCTDTDPDVETSANDNVEDITAKRHRLVDAEMELIQRKRYLIEMKIKYWEEKIKRSSNSSV